MACLNLWQSQVALENISFLRMTDRTPFPLHVSKELSNRHPAMIDSFQIYIWIKQSIHLIWRQIVNHILIILNYDEPKFIPSFQIGDHFIVLVTDVPTFNF